MTYSIHGAFGLRDSNNWQACKTPDFRNSCSRHAIFKSWRHDMTPTKKRGRSLVRGSFAVSSILEQRRKPLIFSKKLPKLPQVEGSLKQGGKFFRVMRECCQPYIVGIYWIHSLFEGLPMIGFVKVRVDSFPTWEKVTVGKPGTADWTSIYLESLPLSREFSGEARINKLGPVNPSQITPLKD